MLRDRARRRLALTVASAGLPFAMLMAGACVGDSPILPPPGGGDAAPDTVGPDGSGGDSTSDADAGPPAATGALLWAGAAPGSLVVLSADVAIDAAGNVVVIGMYGSGIAVDFGNGKTLAPSAGAGFVAKFDAAGKCQWALAVTSATAPPSLRGVAIDPSNGDVVFAGQYAGTVQIGSGTSKISVGGLDMLVVKLTSAGAEKYVRSYGGSGDDGASDITVDSGGRAFFTGGIVRSGATDVSFDGKTTNPPQVNASQGIVVSLDSSGVAQWAKALTVGGPSGAYALGSGIALDLDGNVAIGGEFRETLEVNYGQLPVQTISSPGHIGGYVMKLDGATGLTGWATAIAGAGDDVVTSVATDPARNVIAGFDYTGALTIGPRNLKVFGNQDIGYVRYDSSGALLDSHEFGTANKDELYSVKADAWSEIVLAGIEPSTLDFGLPATGHGNTDGFLVKLGAKGSALWAYGIGGVNADTLSAADINAGGNIAFAGNLTGNGVVATKAISFDGGPFSSALYGVFGP